MEKRKYGKLEIEISRLGFGAWPLGNTAHGHQMTEAEGIDLVLEAVKSGINYFDTAPNYANSRSEMILGKALKGIRDQVVINTKFGHHDDGTEDFSVETIERSIKSSLKRLQTTYIDSLLLHNPNMDILSGKTEHFNQLKILKEQGLIHGYGVSIDTKDELKTVLENLEVDVIELLYNVFAQSTRDLLPKVKEKNIALVIKVPLDSGWLTGHYNENTIFTGIRSRWSTEEIKRRAHLTQSIKTIVGDENLTPYALGFLWSYDEITTVIPGIRTKDQLKEHIESHEAHFPKTLKHQFEVFYDQYIKDQPLPW